MRPFDPLQAGSRSKGRIHFANFAPLKFNFYYHRARLCILHVHCTPLYNIPSRQICRWCIQFRFISGKSPSSNKYFCTIFQNTATNISKHTHMRTNQTAPLIYLFNRFVDHSYSCEFVRGSNEEINQDV